MMVIRPVTLSDLDRLIEMAGLTGFGLTTLPKDADFLRRRILDSQHAFEKMADKPGGETYLFVMEDLSTGHAVGTCGIGSKVGGFEPFYAYRVETSVHESTMLNVRKEIRSLHLIREHNGPSEIGSLFLAPEYRHDGNGRVLSLSRFLFMAEHDRFFDPDVLAEMRGVVDDRGQSAFWDALGRHFFEIEYPKADYLSIINKRFIADLMPTHPIYIPLLPPEAQAAIGQVHEQTRPALEILVSEGFRLNGMVDIFEAGPVLSCPLKQIRTVRASRTAAISGIIDRPIDSPTYLIGNTRVSFRACQGRLERLKDQSVCVNTMTAMALQVKVGDRIRYATLRPPKEQARSTGDEKP
jgi:arginine N-succinyltransferase